MQVSNNLVQLSVGESPCIRGFFHFHFLLLFYLFSGLVLSIIFWIWWNIGIGCMVHQCFLFQAGLGDLYFGIAACIE